MKPHHGSLNNPRKQTMGQFTTYLSHGARSSSRRIKYQAKKIPVFWPLEHIPDVPRVHPNEVVKGPRYVLNRQTGFSQMFSINSRFMPVDMTFPIAIHGTGIFAQNFLIKNQPSIYRYSKYTNSHGSYGFGNQVCHKPHLLWEHWCQGADCKTPRVLFVRKPWKKTVCFCDQFVLGEKNMSWS